MDVKVDKEQNRKEGSEKNSQVSTELNLHGKSGGRKGVDDGVHGEGRGNDGGNRDSGGSLDGGLGHYCMNKTEKQELLETVELQPVFEMTKRRWTMTSIPQRGRYSISLE